MLAMRRPMMALRDRVARLEDEGEGRGPCEVCGHGSGGPVTYEVEWDDGDDASADAPEFCLACGRQLSYVITWSDAERE